MAKSLLMISSYYVLITETYIMIAKIVNEIIVMASQSKLIYCSVLPSSLCYHEIIDVGQLVGIWEILMKF